MTNVLLSGVQLWATLTRLARKGRRNHVAVAYLGKGASRLLPLSNGDTLVVDLGTVALANGQTNPWEVEKYTRRGVKVYNYPNLHAKVFVLGNTVIVGSANVSKRSKSTLLEAAMVSRNPQDLTSARGWVKHLQIKPITPKYLKFAKNLYHQTPEPRLDTERSRSRTLGDSVWLVGTKELGDLSPREDRAFEKAQEKALKQIVDKKNYEVYSIKFSPCGFTRRVKRGDWVVRVHTENSAVRVYQPSMVIGTTRYDSFGGRRSPKVWVHLEQQSNRPKTKSLGAFNKEVTRPGLGRVANSTLREVRSNDQREYILGMWR